MKFSLALALAGTLALAACSQSEEPATPDTAGDEAMSDDNGGGGNSPEDYAAARDEILGRNASDEPMDSGAQDDRFTAACLRSSNQSEEMCRCMSGKATANLTNNGREFLIASLNEDTERVLELRPTMNMTELTQSGMFLVNASTECAAEGHNQ